MAITSLSLSAATSNKTLVKVLLSAVSLSCTPVCVHQPLFTVQIYHVVWEVKENSIRMLSDIVRIRVIFLAVLMLHSWW